MNLRPTRLEEAILDSSLYSNPATSLGVNLIEQTRETWASLLTTKPSSADRSGTSGIDDATWIIIDANTNPALLAVGNTSAHRCTWTGSGAGINNMVLISGFANTVCGALNYNAGLTGGVIGPALANVQHIVPRGFVGLASPGQLNTGATCSFDADWFPYAGTSGAPLGHSSDQQVMMVSDPTTPVRTAPSALSKYLLLLGARATVLSPSQFSSLARQLRALLGDVDEPSAVDSARSVASFRGLIRFLSAVQPSHPSLSISKSGLFVASWSPKRRAKLSLTFADYDGGNWFALSLDDMLDREGEFRIPDFTLPEPFGSWMVR